MAKQPNKASSLKVDQTYISNPFTVILNSFKTVSSVNFPTFWTFLAVGALSLVLGGLVAVAVVHSFKFELSAVWLVLILALLIVWGVILLAAFTKYSLETAKNKKITLMEALTAGYQKAAGYVGLMLLTALIVLGGFVLLIVPGLIFMYWFLLAPYIYMDQNITVTQALRQSKQLVSLQRGEIIGIIGAGLTFSIFGVVPVVGILYSLFFNVVWYVSWSYRYLSGQKLIDKKQSKPATDPANYWALGLGIVLCILVNALASAN